MTRDFIVPLYTGTEPDILDDSDTQRESSVYKEFPNDMPIISPKRIQNQPYEQLELADGGSVERQGFGEGGISIKEFSTKQKFVRPESFRKYLGPSLKNDSNSKSILKALSESGITFADKRGPHGERFLQNVNSQNLEKFSELMKKRKQERNLPRSRFETEEERKQIKNFVLNKIKNKEYVSIPVIKKEFSFEGRGDMQIRRALPKNLIDKLGKEEQKSAAAATSIKIGLLKTKDQADAVDYILNTISKGEDISKKELAKIMNIRESAVEQRMGNLISNIYGTNAGKNKNSFLNKFTYDERNNIVQTLFNSDKFKNLYYSRTKADINSALPENSVLRKESLDKLNNFMKVKKEVEKKFGDVIELEHPLAKNIIVAAGRNPGQSFLRVVPVPKEFNRYKMYFDKDRGQIQRKILDALQKGEDTTELVKELKAKEKAIQTLFGDYDVGRVSSKGNIVRYGSKSLFESDLNQLLKDNLKLVDNLKNNINLNKQNLIPLFKEAKLNVKALDRALELQSPKVTTTDVDNIINKIKGIAINVSEDLSKEDARAVCGKLNLGGLPKGCAELAQENPEKFLKTVAETTKDTSLATKANQAFNFTKKIISAADEVVLLGKGVVGRTVAPLAVLNSALEQFTAGNYREAYRQVFDFLDPLPLIGITGPEKARQEGSIENIRGRIKNENQESFNRLLEFNDVYNKLEDVNTRLERAEYATQDPSAAPESYDPDYINDLKKQQADLNKIVNSSKYQNISNYYSNVVRDVVEETFLRNKGKPKQEEYSYETATQETFNRFINPNLLNQLNEQNKGLYKNTTASAKIFEDQSKIPMSDVQRTAIESMGEFYSPPEQIEVLPQQKTEIPFIEEQEELPSEYIVSAADGGRIGLSGGGGPKIGRRGFLGLIAGAAAAPDLIKSLKGTGQAAKIASKIKIEPAEGMYPWFPKLVEKVKEMGKPFEEKDLIMEPSYKNDPRPFGSKQPTGEEKLTKHVDGDTTFILREYPDGRIAVDIDSPRNQESFGQPVSLYYRPKMEIQNYKGEKKIEPPEFKVLEPEPRLFANGPDDVDITFTEVPKNPKRNTVFGDIEAAERFATGNIKNRKIIPVKQSLRNEMEEDPSTFIMRQSGELGSKARPEEIIKLPEEFATGGRVGFGDGSKDPNKLIPIDPLLQDQSPTDPGRRDVLKLGIAGAGVLGLGKLGLLKLGSSVKPSVFAEAVKGTNAPSWMDSLMTKIIKDGTEIKMPKESNILKKEVQFKNPETGNVQTATLTIDSKSDRMFIEYDSPTNVANQPVVLELYRERKIVPNPGGKSNWFAPDKTKGYNFYATEAGPRVTDWDGTIEFDREDTYFKIIDLKSDISGLKSYATGGKGIDKKIAKEKRAATADLEKNPSDYVPDYEPEIYD